jgi:hypothetical protein
MQIFAATILYEFLPCGVIFNVSLLLKICCNWLFKVVYAYFTFWGRSLGIKLHVLWKPPHAAGRSGKSFESIGLFKKFSLQSMTELNVSWIFKSNYRLYLKVWIVYVTKKWKKFKTVLTNKWKLFNEIQSNDVDDLRGKGYPVTGLDRPKGFRVV